MKEKLEKIYKNSIFLRIIGLSLNIISAILVLIGVLAIAYNDTLLVEKINFNDGQGIVAFAVLIITVNIRHLSNMLWNKECMWKKMLFD